MPETPSTTSPVYDKEGNVIWNVEDIYGMEEEIWRRIVAIHNAAKAMILLAEEESSDHDALVQPMNEQRNALEHIIRAQARNLGMSEDEPVESVPVKEYISENLKKALAHEYRAFFDAADNVSMDLAEGVARMLEPYDALCIRQGLPEYHAKTRRQILELHQAIAKVRGEKDITKGTEFQDIDDYKVIIKELLKFSYAIGDAIPIIAESQKVKNKESFTRKWTLRIMVIIAVVTSVIATWTNWDKIGPKDGVPNDGSGSIESTPQPGQSQGN